MALDVKALNEKSEVLKTLNEDIQTNECFTPSEKESVRQKFDLFEEQRSNTTIDFKKNLDIYHNHIMRLKQIIDSRENVLSRIRDSDIEDISEILGVFESQDLALTEELQKYLDQIE